MSNIIDYPYRHEVLIGWKYPEYPKIEINIDGAAKGNPGLASAGSVPRDAKGKWLVGAI